MNLYVCKIIVIVLLLVLRLTSGLCPFAITKHVRKKYEENRKKTWLSNLMSLSMDFSGGVLLATCFIHMLPEVRNHMSNSMGENYNLPWAELLVCSGFFFVYLVEELANMFRPHDDTTSEQSNNISLISHQNGVKETETIQSNVLMTDQKEEITSYPESSKKRDFGAFFLVLALSFHSLMEGLAIGLEQNTTDVWYLFLAVSIHECIILVCVGNEVISRSSTGFAIFQISLLAIISPLGTLLGTLLTWSFAHPASSQELIIACLQGLAAGTILYVTFFEVLSSDHEHMHRCHHLPGIVKWCFVLLGFALMIGFELLAGHGHSESHHTHHSTTTLPT